MKDADNIITKTPYLFNHVISPNTEICRYMEFDMFLQIMEGKFYVPRKLTFLDLQESGKLPMKIRFAFNGVGNNSSEIGENIKIRQNEVDQYVRNLIQSKFLLTSCWSIYNGENYLMWKSYTGKIGICVRTTIDKLMNSINYEKEENVPICSLMFYNSPNTNESFLESIMKKDTSYQSENEVRFYFVPKRDITNEELIKMGNSEVEQLLKNTSIIEEQIYNSNPINYPLLKCFDIKPSFIESIILSPFIRKQSISCIKKVLTKQYSDIFYNEKKIKESKIIIK